MILMNHSRRLFIIWIPFAIFYVEGMMRASAPPPTPQLENGPMPESWMHRILRRFQRLPEIELSTIRSPGDYLPVSTTTQDSFSGNSDEESPENIGNDHSLQQELVVHTETAPNKCKTRLSIVILVLFLTLTIFGLISYSHIQYARSSFRQCVKNEQCESGICFRNGCTKSFLNRPCRFNNDCDEAFECRKYRCSWRVSEKNIVESKQQAYGAGWSCETDQDCMSNKCFRSDANIGHGLCQPGTYLDGCYDSMDCQQDKDDLECLCQDRRSGWKQGGCFFRDFKQYEAKVCELLFAQE